MKEKLTIRGDLEIECKYGENAWQTPAGLYITTQSDLLALNRFERIEGSALSYNNTCDLDRALQTITHIAAGFEKNGITDLPCIAVGVKHGNACGVAVGDNPQQVMVRMVEGDPEALFGGVIVTNFAVHGEYAKILVNHKISNNKRIISALAAPAITDKAHEVLKRKKGGCRLLVNQALNDLGIDSMDQAPRYRYVRGGILVQPNYTHVLDVGSIEPLNPMYRDEILLAWAIGCTSNSNTITLVKNGMLIANGTGQQSRVDACDLAIKKARQAGHNPEGSFAYSDSFFPFTDGPEALALAGVVGVMASDGSINDTIIKDYCESKGLELYRASDVQIRGFYAH